MTPYDWKTVTKACLPGGEFLLWLTKYKLTRPQSAENKTSNDTQLKTVGSATLKGYGKYKSDIAQSRLSKETLNQIMAIDILTWKSLPPSDGKLSTLSNIKQRPDERYKDFVARLKTAVKKIIKSTEPTDVRTKLKPGQALRGRLGLRKAEALGIPTGSVARPIRKKSP